MGKLTGKVAVVTGRSRGGRFSIARHLAAEGAAVVVNYSSSKEDADRVVADIKKNGGKAVAVQANVSKQADIKRLFAETKKNFDKVDILVNNAGIYEFAPLEEVTPEHFHKQFDLNVLGLILASQEAVKHFGSKGGSIVNISSVAASIRPAQHVGLQRDESGGQRRDPFARPRTRPAQDPRQRDQPGHGRNRRHARRPGSPRATFASKPKRKRRSAASASRRTSVPPPCSSHPTIRPGSPAKHSTSPAAYADRCL